MPDHDNDKTPKETKSQTDGPETKKGPTSDDAGEAEVAEKVEEENEQGFRGAEVDPTPNEHYTVEGVVAGLPTPETDPAYRLDVERQIRGIEETKQGRD